MPFLQLRLMHRIAKKNIMLAILAAKNLWTFWIQNGNDKQNVKGNGYTNTAMFFLFFHTSYITHLPIHFLRRSVLGYFPPMAMDRSVQLYRLSQSKLLPHLATLYPP